MFVRRYLVDLDVTGQAGIGRINRRNVGVNVFRTPDPRDRIQRRRRPDDVRAFPGQNFRDRTGYSDCARRHVNRAGAAQYAQHHIRPGSVRNRPGGVRARQRPVRHRDRTRRRIRSNHSACTGDVRLLVDSTCRIQIDHTRARRADDRGVRDVSARIDRYLTRRAGYYIIHQNVARTAHRCQGNRARPSCYNANRHRYR